MNNLMNRPPFPGAYNPSLANTTFEGGGVRTQAQAPGMPLAPNYLNQLRTMAPQEAPNPNKMGGAGAKSKIVSRAADKTAPMGLGNQASPGEMPLPMTYGTAPFWGGQHLEIKRAGLPLDVLKQVQDWPRLGVGTQAAPMPSQINGPGMMSAGGQGSSQEGQPDPLAQQRYRQYQDMLLRSDQTMADMQANQLESGQK